MRVVVDMEVGVGGFSVGISGLVWVDVHDMYGRVPSSD